MDVSTKVKDSGLMDNTGGAWQRFRFIVKQCEEKISIRLLTSAVTGGCGDAVKLMG